MMHQGGGDQQLLPEIWPDATFLPSRVFGDAVDESWISIAQATAVSVSHIKAISWLKRQRRIVQILQNTSDLPCSADCDRL